MNETLITDLVAQQALDQLDELDKAMEGTLNTFKDIAQELAKGLKINVEVSGDLDKIRQVYETQMNRAAQATAQLNKQQQEQQRVVAEATSVIARQLQEQEKLSKATKETADAQGKQLDVVNKMLGTYDQNITALARINKEMEQLKREYKAGTISAEDYLRKELELKTAKSELQRILNNETKMLQAAGGSYKQLSQELHRLKEAQMNLNDAQRASAEGQALQKQIQDLDAKLKALDADMGNYQRNVGNYAVAGKSLRAELRELTMQMAQMLADGVDPTSEAFLTVAERAGALKDAMADATATINDYANDTQGLTQGISVLETTIGGWQAFEGALSAFGLESQEAAAATQKLMGIMSLMNGIQKISTELTTNGTGAYRAYHAILKLLGIEKAANVAATQAEVVASQAEAVAATEQATAQAAGAAATEAATVASGAHTAAVGVETVALTGATAAATALKMALAALGIGAVIALVVALYEGIKEFNEEAERSAEIIEEMNKANDDANKSYRQSKGEMEEYIHAIDTFNGSKEEEKGLIEELNAKYGDSIGTYQTLNDWKKALINTGLAYIETLEWEARAQAALNAMIAAEKDGTKEDVEFYRDQYYGYMDAVRKERARLQREMQRNSKPAASTSTKTTRSSRGSGKSSSNDPAKDEKNALEEMQRLIDEANELYGNWQQKLKERTIETASVINSTSREAFDNQVKEVTDAYSELEKLLKKDRETTYNETKGKYDAAIAEAEKFKKDTTELERARTKALETIDEEFKKKIEDNAADMHKTVEGMQQDLVTLLLKEITDGTENELAGLTNENAKATDEMRRRYAEELEMAKGNEEEIARIKEEYARANAARAEKYAIRVAEITVAGLEKALEVEGLTDEQRAELSKQLADAQIKLSGLVSDARKKDMEQTVEDEEKARKKRIEKVEKWANAAVEAASYVADFMGSIYDGQLEKLNEQMEAEQTRHDTEIANIEEQEERGAITHEEAELRKREAEQRTAKAQEQIEKKKAQIEYKKAMMDKMNSIAQIGIATALAIMKAAPNWINVALVSALGAAQMAVAIAQPIKAYREGTKGRPHPGGFAVVGDGFQQELIAYGHNVWLTPDEPTLINLPRGAEVFPQVDEKTVAQLGASLPTLTMSTDKATGAPVIINDYDALQQQSIRNAKMLAKRLEMLDKNMTKALKQEAFARYIKSRT